MLAALPPEGASRAQVAAAIQRTTALVLRAMTAAILAARQDARAAATEQVDAELAMVSGVVGEQIAPAPPPDNRQEDTINAEAAAGSYSAAWTALALLALTKWARSDGGGSIQGALVKVTTTIEYRLKRIVATEAARARNDEHRERWRGIVKANPRAAALGNATFRRWDARLDRKVCAVCRGHESEECPIDGTFSQGHEPGEVHPYCRCIATVVVIAADRERPIGVNNTSPAPYIDGSGGSTGKRAA